MNQSAIRVFTLCPFAAGIVAGSRPLAEHSSLARTVF